MGNPELQGRLGRQVASAFHWMEGSRIFLKALGASSSTERRFAHHADKMSDICAFYFYFRIALRRATWGSQTVGVGGKSF